MKCGCRNIRGLTLIELICVMAIMAAIMTISAPSLSGFFKGRSLHEQSRRFLALTRHARSAAISEAAIAELWIDTNEGRYGLNIQTGEETADAKSLEYKLEDNQEFEVDAQQLDADGKATLRFYPDGLMDEENPEEIILLQGEADEILFRKTESGIGYVIDEGGDE